MNDNPPVFNQSTYLGQVIESASAGTIVLHVYATDEDSGENGRIVYEIQSGTGMEPFSISNEGVISTTGLLDREQQEYFNLTVSSEDARWRGFRKKASFIAQKLKFSLKNFFS